MTPQDLAEAFTIAGPDERPRTVYVLAALIALMREKPHGFGVATDVAREARVSKPTARTAVRDLQTRGIVRVHIRPVGPFRAFTIHAPGTDGGSKTLPLFDDKGE